MQRTYSGTRVAVLFTGAASGIGQATVGSLRRGRCCVIGCDADAEPRSNTQVVRRDAGHQAQMVTAEVSAQADVDRMIAHLPGGCVDVLVGAHAVVRWLAAAVDGFKPDASGTSAVRS